MGIDSVKLNWAWYLKYNQYTGELSTLPSHLRHPSAARGSVRLRSHAVNGVVFVTITIYGEDHHISAGRLVHYLHIGVMPDREPIYLNNIANDLRWENLRYRDIGFVEHTQTPTNARVRPITSSQDIYAADDPPEGVPLRG